MLSSSAAVRLVASREVNTRLRSRAFRITTVAMLVVVVGFLVTLKLVGGSSGNKVGFTPSAAPLAGPLTSVSDALGQTVTPSTVNQADGEAQVRSGDLDALVTGTPDTFAVLVKKNLSPDLRDALQVLARQIALNDQIVRAGADPAAVTAAVEHASFSVAELEPTTPYRTERLVLGLIAGILVYIALMIYGQAVAQGVVEEKSSRIVELLLTTIRP